jgi:hypothetical protein
MNAATIACQTTADTSRREALLLGLLSESKASLLSGLGTPSMPPAQPLQ